MQNRLANLLTVKSIVTIVLTAVFSVLALRGSISGTGFLTIFTTLIAFYFGTQTEKKKTAGVNTQDMRSTQEYAPERHNEEVS